ncbi:MAG: molecular chaperone DnaJ [Caulobacteraceae bacterium]|jgi:hypothetical protein|nr:molecular chaperone DnaJ [Caulobacteraceae bacterium]
MIYLAIGAGLLLLWMWGRSEMIRRGGWRVFAGLASVVLVVVGISLSIRGDWFIGLPMVLLAVGAATGGRINRGGFRPTSSSPPDRPRDGMSGADARSILGVGPEASVEDIRAAYTRLMQRAHPDKGGSAGLAAQLNAARDRLLKG